MYGSRASGASSPSSHRRVAGSRHRRRVCRQEDTLAIAFRNHPAQGRQWQDAGHNKRRKSDHLLIPSFVLTMISSKEVMNTADRLEAVELASEAANQKGEDEGNVKQCASCGQSSGALKKCMACKSVWYCGVSCQKGHRKAHKQECKRIEKELKGEKKQEEGKESKATGQMEEEMFSLWKPKPRKVCPICMCLLPTQTTLTTYFSCCGTTVCCGCAFGTELAAKDIKAETAGGEGIELHIPSPQNVTMHFACPFCRTEGPKTDEEIINQIQKRLQMNDGDAMEYLALHYRDGMLGLPVDEAKCLELMHKAADHGSLGACYDLGVRYCGKPGSGVPLDFQKGVMYWTRGAVRGDLTCRFNLGMFAMNMGDMHLAARHFELLLRVATKMLRSVALISLSAASLVRMNLSASFAQSLKLAKKKLTNEKTTSDI